MSAEDDVKRMIIGGVQPQHQQIGLKVAAPLNDLQLVCMMASEIYKNTSQGPSLAVNTALEMFCQANARFNGMEIMKRIEEIKQELATTNKMVT